MTKVKCKNCKHWHEEGRTRKRGSLVSLHFNYEPVGCCFNMDCAEETSGYTGIVSGHKMRRLGECERYCKFFESKVSEEKEGLVR